MVNRKYSLKEIALGTAFLLLLLVIVTFYILYQAEAIQLPFQRGKETTYKVKFQGLADAARPAGDQVGKLYRQT